MNQTIKDSIASDSGDGIIVVDIETTNFLHRGGLIVEIGIVKLDLKTGEIKMLYNELVKEKGFDHNHFDSWIFNNSDLKPWAVMKANPLDHATLRKIFEQHLATAWNTSFDFSFLRDRALTIQELPCPMMMSAEYFAIKRPTVGFKWAKVQEAWDKLFPEKYYLETHRGFDDAAHEAKIIHELYKRGVYKI